MLFKSLGAWGFDFFNGNQDFDGRLNVHYSWAVDAGNIGAVPLPTAV